MQWLSGFRIIFFLEDRIDNPRDIFSKSNIPYHGKHLTHIKILHYIGGIRMNTTDRQGYIDAIIKLLEKADLHKLRLVWVYASHLIK